MKKNDIKPNILKKLLGIAAIIVALQIPIMKIDTLPHERGVTNKQAIKQVQKSSGSAQRIFGPLIAIPYSLKAQDSNMSTPKTIAGYTYLYPESLQISAKLTSENRNKGIFKIPVYTADIEFSGGFSAKMVQSTDSIDSELLWDQASLTIGISDPKTIRDQQAFEWNDQKIEFEPGSHAPVIVSEGIHLKISGLTASDDRIQTFKSKITISGTQALYFIPTAKVSNINISGDWADPSFEGSYAPLRREVGSAGFSADWKVSNLGFGFEKNQFDFNRQARADCSDEQDSCSTNKYELGVRLINAVDTYVVVARSIKYQALIIILTFTTFFIFELLYGLRLHPMQYLLVGLALVLFYLLLLSLSEHIGFSLAYFIASLSVIGLVGAYSLSILKGRQGALTIITAMSALYLYLFSALTSEDYALLSGSLGFMTVLALVMYCTRNIDWYELNSSKAEEDLPVT